MGPWPYTPAREPAPVWSVDRIGDAAAAIVIFAAIWIVGLATFF